MISKVRSKPAAATRPGRAPPHPQAWGATRDPEDACPQKPLLHQSPIRLLWPCPGRPLPLSACCPAAPSALRRWGDPVPSADRQGIIAALGPQQVSGSPAVLGPAPPDPTLSCQRERVSLGARRAETVLWMEVNLTVQSTWVLALGVRKDAHQTQIPLPPSSCRGSPSLRGPGWSPPGPQP